MEDHICPIVRWHLKLFRLFCFSPISLHSDARKIKIQERLWLLWSIVVFILFNIVSYGYYRVHTIFLITQDGFEIFVDSIKILTTLVNVNVCILEPFLQKSNERNFWNYYIILSSQRQLRTAPFWIQVKEYKTFLLKFYSYFMLNQICEVIILALHFENNFWRIFFWLVFVLYTYFMRFKTMQIMFYLDLMTVEIECLDRDLALLVEYTEFGIERCSFEKFEKFDEFVRKSLLAKQRVYGYICDMVECFKKANGLAIVANYFKCFVRVLTNFGWFYWASYNSQLSYKDVLLVPAVLEIPMFLLTAKSCMNAAKYISYRVHNLKHSADNIAASVQIQNFSLQLLHQQIKIDGLGIASMDGYMLTKAVGSITTYMVFFIQFMPKFKSKFD